MKIYKDGIEWGSHGEYYFYWWNWLPKENRYIGRQDMLMDGAHASFGLWFTNISWSTYWTKFRK